MSSRSRLYQELILLRSKNVLPDIKLFFPNVSGFMTLTNSSHETFEIAAKIVSE